MYLKDRRNKVLLSDESCRKSAAKYLKYFDSLKKDEIINELNEREVSFFMDEGKASLQKKLEKTLHGIQRVPSLLFSCPQEDFNNINLGRYELLMEPMHDNHNHIKNVFHELPHHFLDEKKDIVNFIAASFNGKGILRCVDYRKSLLLTALHCQQKYPDSVMTDIFVTPSQIQELLYLSDNQRSCQKILKLYVLTFRHAMLLHQKIKSFKQLTSRKMYGKYFHSI